MSLLLDRWKKEIKPKIQATNNKNKNAGPQPATGNSTGSTKSTLTGALLSNKTIYGGSTSSGGSSGSTSSKNSQYTAPTLGNTYDANTDYATIINNAVANGDYMTAAKAEQLRNQKIIAQNMDYARTNTYGGYLDGTDVDLSVVGRNQMSNGASKDDVEATYLARLGKIAGNDDLSQYSNDWVQQMMYDYIYGGIKEENQPEDFEYDEEKPTEPKSDPRIDRLLAEILNREDFSYDVMNDPLYQQYAAMYQREGDRAMRETMAEAAASAGGMNSWAMTAANQANQYYNSQLNDKIPELYQLAYNMYLQDKESKVQDLGILQDMDATQYNRYRDTINDYYNDKNFAYGMYQDALQQSNWQTNFDYNAFLNNRDFTYNNAWANREWDANQADKDLANSRYDQEAAKEEVWKYISLGVTPSANLIAKAGMTETDVALAVAAVKAEQEAQKKTKNVGGSDSNGYDKPKQVDDEGNDKPKETQKKGDEIDMSRWEGSENYQAVDDACKELLESKGKSEVLAYLKRIQEEGALDQSSYMLLYSKYRG